MTEACGWLSPLVAGQWPRSSPEVVPQVRKFLSETGASKSVVMLLVSQGWQLSGYQSPLYLHHLRPSEPSELPWTEKELVVRLRQSSLIE